MISINKNPMNIAILPARGESKRIPRKNIKLFCGKPIIACAMMAAQKTNQYSKVFKNISCASAAQIE